MGKKRERKKQRDLGSTEERINGEKKKRKEILKDRQKERERELEG